MKRAPRVFFSFRSPFSWLAIERLQRAVPDAHDVLQLIPYWEPDPQTQKALEEQGAGIQYVPMSKAKHLYILQDTKRLAEELGIGMAWPVDHRPWWEVPHLGWLKARRMGRGAAFYTAVVAARWQRGEDICDPSVICALAASIGLDGSVVGEAVNDPDVRAEGVRCLYDAYEDDIFGVPYFRVGRHRFWGIDRLDGFLRALLPTLGRAPTTPGPGEDRDPFDSIPAKLRSDLGAYDTDTAGGCG